MERDQLVVDKINEAVRDGIEEVKDFRGERTLYIKANRLKKVCQLLRDDEDLQYNLLADISADDLLPEVPRFAVSYHLCSIPFNHRLRLRVLVEDPDKGPATMGGIWPIATWLETEVWDLMGVNFKGNNALRRLFMPEDWQGHPLRKDYPLGYEEVQFSFNWEEIGSRKPHPKE
ncbi:MAG: NADH-quinone oxidoreductase subunit C [Candidatus Promineifilaceae bacterium]|nr:NADH-quinone oxidoreductase subunit C [Candidatus Promineifilaceae bacterium]